MLHPPHALPSPRPPRRAVALAEIVHHYFPKLVELHNYSPAHNSVQKMYNWTTLNQKVGSSSRPACLQAGVGSCSRCLEVCAAPRTTHGALMPAEPSHCFLPAEPHHCFLPCSSHESTPQVFRRMGFALAREQQEAVANAEAGAIERVLKLVRAKMARFQEGGGRGGAPAAGAAAATSTSQPGSPARFAAASPAAVDAAADRIAAVRLAAEVPAKLLVAGAAGGVPAAFPTLDKALAASLADKEAQLEELRETNQV